MKNKIFILILTSFLSICSTPTLLAKSTPNDDKVLQRFKPVQATDVEIVKKSSLPGKGKPISPPGKISEEVATGILGDTVAGNRYAVVIGISDYPGISSDLHYTDNDALAMRNVLTGKYGFDDANIYLLTDGETAAENPLIVDGSPSYENIQQAVSDLKYNKGLTPNDEVVFFFSGHGGKGIADDGDAEKIDESIVTYYETGEFAYIWDGELKNWFTGFPTQRVVFIFDSCVSGGMTDLADTGRVINMATEEKRFDTAVESVYDGVGAGEFTYYFVIKGMGEELADTTGTTGVVTVEEAFDYTKKNTDYDHPTVSDKFENDLLL